MSFPTLSLKKFNIREVIKLKKTVRCISLGSATTPPAPPPSSHASSVRSGGPSLRLTGSKNFLEQGLGAKKLEGEHPIGSSGAIDWSTSWHGFGAKPFGAEVQRKLSETLEPLDIEIKPDGMVYLPEIKYRRILNKTFGAGGWGLVPRSQTLITTKLVTREYGLICHNQLVSVARGEQDYFNETGIPTATEGCKSNALMRCCKDLGIGSELWDPVFIKKFKAEHCLEKFVEHISTKKKKKIWLRKDRQVEYPYK